MSNVEKPRLAELRAAARTAMAQLEQQGIDCRSCSGVCCTFQANSMEITVEEAEELYAYLEMDPERLETGLQACRDTIEKYQLHRPVAADFRGRPFRRTYTCPFYAGGSLGCTIEPNHKPIGCLRFNPLRPHQVEGGNCRLLTHVEMGLTPNNASDEEMTKSTIPVAVLKIHDQKKWNVPKRDEED